MIKRSSGVLLHLSSLPGPFASGSIGQEARLFVRTLADMGCAYWQLLPINHLSDIRSPYSARSLFAINPNFIDMFALADEGLLSLDEINEATSVDDPADVVKNARLLEKKRQLLLRKAFARSDENVLIESRLFAQNNAAWLFDYALFCTLKEKFDGKPWFEWSDIGLRLHKPDAVSAAAVKNAQDVAFWSFIQYVAYSQWTKLKAYANSLGVSVIGDIPIYAALDSADVWASHEYFALNTKHIPKLIAGVPPDYFNSDGQLWGNPTYNWTALKRDGYSWWIRRIENSLLTFDILRIDHYRGFYNYWAVPFANKTARKGSWMSGPGMEFVNLIKKRFADADIVVENLGDLDEEVSKFFLDSGFPGMRVMQFGYGLAGAPEHRPKEYSADCVAYTGTHDNNTIVGWYGEAAPDAILDSLRDLGFIKGEKKKRKKRDVDKEAISRESILLAESIPSAEDLCRAWINALFMSAANVAIAPMQDILVQGEECRMNRPGLEDDATNWSYRLTQEQLEAIDTKWLRAMNAASKRLIK